MKNVLFELAHALKAVYPDADVDSPDLFLKKAKKTNLKMLDLVIMF